MISYVDADNSSNPEIQNKRKGMYGYCLDTLIAMKRYNWLTEWLQRLAKFDKRCTKQYQSVAHHINSKSLGLYSLHHTLANTMLALVWLWEWREQNLRIRNVRQEYI